MPLRTGKNEQAMHLRRICRNGTDDLAAQDGNIAFTAIYVRQNILKRMKIMKCGHDLIRIFPRITRIDRAGYQLENFLRIGAARFPYLKFTHLFVFKMDINTSEGTSTEPMLRIRFLPSFCFSSNFFLRVMSPP